MGLFAYTVETFDGSTRRTLGDFRRQHAAFSAARHSITSPRVTLAVVKDADGVMVYATDGEKTWTEGEVMPIDA